MGQTTVKRVSGLLGDLSGSVADFGTFLPLVVGVLAVRRFDAAGVLVGFGLFALAVAAFYRRPVPVQPMKVVTALIIAGALTPAQAMAAGLIIGAVLTVLAVAGVVGRIASLVPGSVVMGVQLGVGAQLALLGLRHVAAEPRYGIAALVVLAALHFTRFRNLSSLLVVVVAAAVSLAEAPHALSVAGPGFTLPGLGWPAFEDFRAAALTTVLPQLALTFSNAVLATAAIAAEYFPDERRRLSPGRLAASTGVLNLALVPFGALPMCHGSGGLVAQYGFGARTWVAPAVFGVFCLVLGLCFGADAPAILAVIPLGAVGAMLAVAGAQLAIGRRLFAVKPSCRVVVVLTGIGCLATNIAAGLLIGLVLEAARTLYARWRGERPASS